MAGVKASDRVYLLIALLFVVTAIAGFAPTSISLVSMVASGQQDAPSWVLHAHAASMSLWLLLLLAQATLIHVRRPDLHQKLGLTSLVLAPCVLLSMYGVEIMNAGNSVFEASGLLPNQSTRNVADSLLIHGVSFLFFPFFFLWAIAVRRKDSESHKRLMLLATLVLMIPGLGRLLSVSEVLPDFGLSIIDARHFYMFALILPAVIHDIVKNGKPHRSYGVGLLLISVWVVSAHFLWGSSWWIETAPRLLGL